MSFNSSTTTNNPLLILIDGHSLAFRSYYAFTTSKTGGLRTSSGIPTSICFGFINSLLQAIESQKPEFVAIAFDRREPTFRHQADANYKADRPETPEDFIPDLENLQELLTALDISLVTFPGYEADDILATLAAQAVVKGYRVKILSGDRDLFQLVDKQKNVSVLYLDNTAIKNSSDRINYPEFDPEAVEEKLGIKPEQIVDYKALCGDKSDNIPGVRGIGDKTAVKLLKEYKTLAGVYQNIDKMKGALKQKLLDGQESAQHSQYLAQLIFDVPLELKIESCRLQGFSRAKVIPLLEKLQLNKFIKKIDSLQERFGGKIETPLSSSSNQQLSLFDLPTPITPEEIPTKEALVKPLIVDREDKLSTLIKILQKPDRLIAWDTETSSLDPRHAELIGIGCCWGNTPEDTAYIAIGHLQGKNLDKQLVLSTLRPILESKNHPKAFQNAKFDRLVLLHQGIKLAGVAFDTMLASYIIDPETTHNLTDLSKRYLQGIEALSYKDLNIPKGKTIADLDIETTANYCALDAYGTFCLVEPLQTKLNEINRFQELFSEIELPLEEVLANMEARGVRLNSEYLQKFSQELSQDLGKLEETIYRDAQTEFNLDSPKQLSDVLFEKLGLDRKKSQKIQTGYSTNHATLEKLQGDHPIIDRLLEYRTLSKLKSTYVDALPQLVDPQTQRLHTDFNQTVTATGRLSSSNPNLQNIPIRTEFSRKIRQAFLPAQNWLLASADYSQIELRILAHFSQEPVLLTAYQNDDDVHTVTAKLLFDKEEVTSEERRMGKIINFGVIYGMGAQRFARESGISSREAKIFIDKYREKYALVFAYLENLKKTAIAQGYITTIAGRRRYFNFTSESLRNLRGCKVEEIDLDSLKLNNVDAQLLRAAANSAIQGSSADIIKIAMIKLHHILEKYETKLLLQVHDELVLEMPLQESEELPPKIKSIMENAVQLTIPLVVDVCMGNNWMEAK
jgi:DNA polymerase-1